MRPTRHKSLQPGLPSEPSVTRSARKRSWRGPVRRNRRPPSARRFDSTGRRGYVYVISNRGSFGPNMVKIGMTRRLEPLDRVRELGDASVPFAYDVHALFFSDDAVSLEAELHRLFADRRVNLVNLRREFFFVPPTEVRDALVERVGAMLEFSEHPESLEYVQSRTQWPAALGGPGGS